MNETLNNLMNDLEGKDKILAHQTDLLYKLHNEIYPDLKEYNISCGSCRERVYNRVREFWLLQKQK